AAAVIFGVAFGVLKVRQVRAQKQRESMFALVRSLQTREMLVALDLLDNLPEGLSRADLRNQLGAHFADLQLLLGTWESLGIMVFYGEVSLDLVDEFYSGPIVHSWSKLRRLVDDVRRETRRETRWEWFQWLAERMLAREATTPPVPAYIAHRKSE
ncbi:MAG: DUF4760 domain-containing protein, partial [Burkholderiales bacterium]